MHSNPLLTASACELARRIRLGEVSSVEVVDAHIDRIAQVNPRLNAVVCERFDEARREAREADRLRETAGAAELPPLHGVPCTIKESFALTGMPNTAGLVSRQGRPAPRDAVTVARLRSAGAIPLGVTNVSELCMWMESQNFVYGRSRNPYDPARIVGGSSGGEGAVIGAGGSPFGLGSDIAGSIRMPAFFNGVFGHKPSGGLVPGTGQFPLSEGDARRYLTTGPLARRAEDLHPLLRILSGPDGEDYGCREMNLGDPATVELEGLKVVDVPDNGFIGVSAELRAAQRRVADWLASRGAQVHRVHVGPGRLELLRRSLLIWSSMLSAAGGASYAELLADGGRFHLGWEALRSLWRGSPFTIPSLGLAALELLPKLLPGSRDQYVRQGHELRRELEERIGSHGVMLFPPYPTVAPRHVVPLFPPFNWVYTAIVSVMELPATQVPLGLNARGLPLGLQVITTHGNDHVSLAVAQALERAFGGWVPPPR